MSDVRCAHMISPLRGLMTALRAMTHHARKAGVIKAAQRRDHFVMARRAA
jgi:hypothetical protein